VTFPEDYHADDLAGKDAVFQVKIHEVKAKEVPEIDDEFAQDISEFDTLAELREDILKRLEKQGEQRAEAQMKDELLSKIYAENDVSLPEPMVETEMDRMMSQYEQQLKQQGISMEQFFELIGSNKEQVRERFRQEAEQRVGVRLILSGIARQEEIVVTDEDIERELTQLAEQVGQELDDVRENYSDYGLKLLREELLYTKVMDFLYENAVAQDPEEAAEEAAVNAAANAALAATEEAEAPAATDVEEAGAEGNDPPAAAEETPAAKDADAQTDAPEEAEQAE